MPEAEIDALFWCPVRNGYADDETCGTQGAGVSHGHYEIDVDVVTGRVLTPAEVQYERQRVAGYFVAPDASDTVTLWRGQPGDTRPQPVVSVRDFRGHRLLWDHLVRDLVEVPGDPQ